jgi:tetratricopeptide (TPR) repeat protein
MYTQDYIKRMLNQLVAVIQMIIGLKAAGQYGQALQAIDQALEQLLGLKPDIAKRLSDEAILNSLTQANSLDTDRLLIVADLFKEEGDVYAALNRPTESFSSHLRALNFYIEAALAGVEGDRQEPDDKLEDLYHQLSKYQLPSTTLYGSFTYFEGTGRFKMAASILSQLLDVPALREEVHRESLAFYQRLREKSDLDLENGELTRSEVEERLSKFADS